MTDPFAEVRGKRMSELSPEQQDLAHELWLRDNVRSFLDYYWSRPDSLFPSVFRVIDRLRTALQGAQETRPVAELAIDTEGRIAGSSTESTGLPCGLHKVYATPQPAADFDSALASIEASRQRRAQLMPTEQDAVHMMWQAYQRLGELGWRNTVHCPRDGVTRLFIEVGSTGIHEGHCDDAAAGRSRPTVWLHSHNDWWPSQPVMFKEKP